MVIGSRPGLSKEVVFMLDLSNKEWAIQKNQEDFYLRNMKNSKADNARHSERVR